jgi:hypothetical protein
LVKCGSKWVLKAFARKQTENSQLKTKSKKNAQPITGGGEQGEGCHQRKSPK